MWENASGGTTNYRMQLDCLHYPDPQTGQERVVAGMGTGAPECPDRSGTVTSAEAPTAGPSGTATATPTGTGNVRSLLVS